MKSVILHILTALQCFMLLSCSAWNNSGLKTVEIKRFDIDLLNAFNSDTVDYNMFAMEYPAILNIYATGIIRCSLPGDSTGKLISDLKSVYSGSAEFRNLYEETERSYSDISDIEKELSDGFESYLHFFPDKSIPEMCSHISGFSQSIIVADSLISISLDNYLGEVYPGYKGVFFDYQLKGRRRDRIATDVFTVCLYNDFPYNGKTRRVIDGMIYEGSIIYVLSRILRDRSLPDILNYSQEQMKWSNENEENIWSYIVKSGHIYSSNPLVYSKYMNDAPYTSFFGPESPDRLGRFIGYRIIERYIGKTGTEQGIRKILNGEYDTTDILIKSGYGNN